MTRDMKRTVGIVMALMGSVMCLDACSVEYSAAPIAAHLVDAETGQPVADAHVVAHWQLEGGPEGGSARGAVTTMEAQTDDSGRFQFPAWGPKEVPRSFGIFATPRVNTAAPQLLFFKSGYEWERMQNYSDVPSFTGMRSDWDGKTIKLKPFHGNSAEYANALGGLSTELEYNTARGMSCSSSGPCTAICQWQNIPRMIRAIGKQFKIFEADGVRSGSIYDKLISGDAGYRRAGCASAKALLGGENK